MVYKSTVNYSTVQRMFEIYLLLGEALFTKFNHVTLLNMLVVMNTKSPGCYAISGIPALPTATSGFFGCRAENSALLSEFKIPDDPIFYVCSLHQQWKRLHVTLIVVLWVPFLCLFLEHCSSSLWGGIECRYVVLVDITMLTTKICHKHRCTCCFLFLSTHTLKGALRCDITLVSRGQHVNPKRTQHLVSSAAQYVY